MTHALVSWQDNDFVDRIADGVPWLTRLVWVRPGGPGPGRRRGRLAGGAVGLKLHPSYDEYPADTAGLDPFLEVAGEAGVPVTVHTAPGPSDPDLIRRLAERFPQVPFVLYHTFLGLPEGRRRAARHAQQVPNLYLETSWCRADEVRRLIDEVGVERVLFGSDAAVDGPEHFVRQPPNVEMVETYNEGLLSLARTLPADTFRALVQDNTRRLVRSRTSGDHPGGCPRAVRRRARDGRAGDRGGRPGRPRAAHTVHRVGRPRPARAPGRDRPAGRQGGARCPTLGVGRGAARTVRPLDDDVRLRGPEGAGGLGGRRPAGRRQGPVGTRPAPVALSGFVLELVAHTHDLAVGIERTDLLDDDLALAALGIAERLVPPGLRSGSEAFAAPDPASSTADGYGRLAAFVGRSPR